MNKAQTLDVRELIDNRPIGGYQKWVVFFGFLIIALDGFDVAIMGFIAPQLRMDWGIDHQALGPVLSAALVGLAIGALVAGPLADRYGRKIVLVVSTFFFGFWTLATAFSTDITMMVILRFLTGLGLGAAMPNASTLVSEYAPERSRSFLITVAFCGFSLGAAGGGFLSAWMIPNLGWHSVLVLGGVLPLIVAPILYFKLPESVSFLVAKNAPAASILHIIDRLAPGLADANTHFVVPKAPVANTSAARIVLSPRYRFGTLMLWTGYFLSLFLVYLFSSWLPTLVKEGGGYSIADAAIVTSMFQVGGPVGALTVGWAMDRWSRYKVIMLTFLVAGVVIFAIGHATHEFVLLCMVAWAVGFCLNGSSVGMNALAAYCYPTEARATGVSWMSGVGRFGAILSAFAGAQMMSLGWSFEQIFAVLVIPAGLAALAVHAQGRQYARTCQAYGLEVSSH
ncbi:MFS transporter [Pseudomonas sp. X10]